MNMSIIRKWIQQGESETVEFKKSTAELSKTMETLCGFLNHQGGKVIIGVNEKGKMVGQTISDATRREVAQALQKFEPTNPIKIFFIQIPKQKNYLIIFEANSIKMDIPYTYQGRAYQRIQSTTSIIPQSRYQQLLLTRMQKNYSWEKISASHNNFRKLDQNIILRALKMGIDNARIPATAIHHSPKEVLAQFGLIYKEHLMNASIVLFGKEFLPDYPQCVLRMARFKGQEKNEFIDNQQVHDHAFGLLDAAMLFVSRHLPIASRILPDRLQRMDEPLFPHEAIREALVNAVCHRDYSIPGGSIDLAIYENCMEITSYGKLPDDIKMDDLKKRHRSFPRNPIIANVLYRCGYIEQWGRGIQKIIDLCVEAGHPEPEFFEAGNTFNIKFLARKSFDNKKNLLDTPEQRQEEILRIIEENKQISLKNIMKRLGNIAAERTIRDDLSTLKNKNKIALQGRGRSAVWNKAE
jgi:ATP-dependent DNA helicase RecG